MGFIKDTLQARGADNRNLTWSDVMAIQDILNTKADPKNPDWRAIRQTEDFALAQVTEYAELIESTPWKWWKKGTMDTANIKIEIIDILHFLSSEIILISSKYPVFHLTENLKASPVIFPTPFLFDITSRYDLLQLMQAFATTNSSNLNDTLNSKVTSFLKLAGAINMSNEEASAFYICKATLNEIRWDGGYYADTYKKIKSNGMEDNTLLYEVVAQFLRDEKQKLEDLPEKVREYIGTYQG